ncbi:MAG: penicillin-binding protein 2 [Gammaproteobacteria bacterium]|nr:MAG: penicillin-binding protein 2 [Gammaproteobacteria bacterium]
MNQAVPFKNHWKEQRLFLSRLIAAGIIILLSTGVLVSRLFQLQIVEHQQFAAMSQGNRLRIEPLAPTRGLIFDRNGVVLAENLPTWELVLIPEEVADLDVALDALEALGLVDPDDRNGLTELVRSHRGFERVKLRNLTEEEAARFAVRRHHFPGVDIREGLVRSYPYGEAVAHALGYVASISPADLRRIERSEYAASSNIGKTGVERSYEQLLHGVVGYRQQVVNAPGRVLFDPAANTGLAGAGASPTGLETKWPIPGDNLILAIDIRLQLAAAAAMEGVRGAVVAIDPTNGDVLTFFSAPSFDLNRFPTGLSRTDLRALTTDSDEPLFNRALAGTYPPGSVIKPFLALAALDYGVVDADHEIMCPGYFMLPGQSRRYRDWKPQGHGRMDLHQAIIESCDVYFYQLAVTLEIDSIAQFLRTFGFGAATGLDISGEARGIVPSREWKRSRFARPEEQIWFPGETVITGIGQGFTLVTPLQLAHANATLASRGKPFQPRLVIGTENGMTGEVILLEPRAQLTLDLDDADWQRIHDAMLGVTEDIGGSAREVMAGTAYRVAGKTGTAQVYSLAQDEEYDEENLDERLRDHGLFLAYAPAEAPSISLAVVVENRGGGSRTAAPIARQILDVYFTEAEYVARQL